MPGTVLLEARYCQEIAPKSKDRAERVRDDVTIETSAGTFENCLVVDTPDALLVADLTRGAADDLS